MDPVALYQATDPLVTAFWASLGFAGLCWVLSIVTGEYSWVDRLWVDHPGDVRRAFRWACRLQRCASQLDGRSRHSVGRASHLQLRAQGWIRAGRRRLSLEGNSTKDWREVVSGLERDLSSLPFQNVLLLLIVVPSYAAYQRVGTPLNTLDYAAVVAFTLFLLGETIADEQQWRFQTAKYAAKARGATPEADFLTTGLFRYSRHPNFFCEHAMWWIYYVFSIAAGAGWLNWTVTGTVLLTLLFQGSTGLTEQMSLQKYPAYADYQRATSRLMPWFRGL